MCNIIIILHFLKMSSSRNAAREKMKEQLVVLLRSVWKGDFKTLLMFCTI